MDSQISEDKYQECLDWLFSRLPMFSRVGAAAYKPGLENTLELDRLFDHPHKKFRTIHVAGTNGKGSTSHMLAAVLQAQGYRTGLYTSPHLVDFRERIRIDGKMIPKAYVIDFVDRWRLKGSSLQPSFFELTMMMAFDWFAREKVDYAVIETGMGGRLDSTNIISPILSVITNISFDHTQFLGHTLEAIAKEKAGIIKEGVPVVIGEAEREVKEVFISKALDCGAPIAFAKEVESQERVEINEIDGGYTLRFPDTESPILIPLSGSYQKMNIRTVACALLQLRKEGVKLNESAISQGLSKVSALTGLRGRWQTVSEKPLVICDTGHNAAGLGETMKTLSQKYQHRVLRFVIGFVNDKDVSHIVGLFPREGEYYFTQASIPRALQATDVGAAFERVGISGRIFPSVEEAFGKALEEACEDDVIYIGGSTFIVADFLKTREDQENARF